MVTFYYRFRPALKAVNVRCIIRIYIKILLYSDNVRKANIDMTGVISLFKALVHGLFHIQIFLYFRKVILYINQVLVTRGKSYTLLFFK
jgi:hypothetical protein